MNSTANASSFSVINVLSCHKITGITVEKVTEAVDAESASCGGHQVKTSVKSGSADRNSIRLSSEDRFTDFQMSRRLSGGRLRVEQVQSSAVVGGCKWY